MPRKKQSQAETQHRQCPECHSRKAHVVDSGRSVEIIFCPICKSKLEVKDGKAKRWMP